jgi:ribonucleoside-diphosphate reductase alpha chain
MEVGAWVHRHFDEVVGMTFLPTDDNIYQQAPYEATDEATYEDLLSQIPESFDWDHLREFEFTDNTEGARELACSAAGGCEVA